MGVLDILQSFHSGVHYPSEKFWKNMKIRKKIIELKVSQKGDSVLYAKNFDKSFFKIC